MKKETINYWLALCPAIAAASTAWAGLALGVLSLLIALLAWAQTEFLLRKGGK